MAKVQRVGDRNSEGGRIIKGENSVRVNGKPIAVVNEPVTIHPRGKEHNDARTRSTKNSTVKANGKRIIVDGDIDSCGHRRINGSPNVNIG